jgi:hypothetical protein
MTETEQRVADAIYAADIDFDGRGNRYEHLARAAIAATPSSVISELLPAGAGASCSVAG